MENKAKVDDFKEKTVGHGGEVWRASPNRHWTARESEERAAREDDWPKEPKSGYRDQPM